MKPTIVQKYGGSSVADLDKLKVVARLVVERARAGNRMVVVVSAMGKTTDRLIAARMDACRLRGVPMLWWTGPSTAPSDLGDRLLRIGFFLEPAYGMAADLHAAGDATSETTVGGLAIERVRDHAALREWSRVLCDAFGAPPSFGDAFAAMADGIGFRSEGTYWASPARPNFINTWRTSSKFAAVHWWAIRYASCSRPEPSSSTK